MRPLVPPLSLPSPAPTATVPSTAAVLIVVLIIVVVHLMPTVAAASPLASQRWAGSIVTDPVAALAEGAEEVDLPNIDLCLRRQALLCLLHPGRCGRCCIGGSSSRSR